MRNQPAVGGGGGEEGQQLASFSLLFSG